MTTIHLKGAYRSRDYEIPEGTDAEHLRKCIEAVEMLTDSMEDLPATSDELLSLVEIEKPVKANKGGRA